MQNYAAYNDEGEGVGHDLESVVTSRSIPSNGRLVVTVTGNSVTFTGDVEKATYYSASEPALLKKTLAKDETFIVVNTSSQSETIQFDLAKQIQDKIYNETGVYARAALVKQSHQ